MPRDSGGQYVLPLAPVVADTIISTDWANPTTEDLAVAMTDSLSRTGNGGMLAPMKLINGGASAPAYSFNADNLTGLFLQSVGVMAITAQSAKIMTFDGVTDLITSNENHAFAGWLRGVDGSAAAPQYSFTADTNTGMYRVGADVLGFSVGGANALTVSATALTATAVLMANGSVAQPTYSFTSDTDTGMYRFGANDLGMASGGVNVFRFLPTVCVSLVTLASPLGTAAAVGLRVGNDSGTGLFNTGGNDVALSRQGEKKLETTATGIAVTGVIKTATSGTALLPSYTFIGDENTGMYRPATDQVALAANATIGILCAQLNTVLYANGVEQLRTKSTGIALSNLPTSNPGGTGNVWNDSGTLKIT